MLLVSLTTIPTRINTIYQTLSSLVNQNISEDYCIYVNIPHNYRRKFETEIINTQVVDLKSWISKYKYPVIINRCEDYGPATKFLGVWDICDDDDKVIIVDDDRIYDEDLIKRLVQFSSEFPNYVITEAGWTITKSIQGIEYKKEGVVDILGGCCGALIKKRFFRKEVLSIPNNPCFFVDDIWFSGHSLVPIYVTGSKGRDAIRHSADAVDSLCDETVVSRKDATEFAINYFRLNYKKWEL